jgi:hypothetical protein
MSPNTYKRFAERCINVISLVYLVVGKVMREAVHSYWDFEDHLSLTELLRDYGVPIRFVKSYPDHRVYMLAGFQLHVYKSLNALKRYRHQECTTILHNYDLKKSKRGLWVVLYGAGSITSETRGRYAIFSVNRDIHVVTPDTSVGSFVDAVGLITRMIMRRGCNVSSEAVISLIT